MAGEPKMGELVFLANKIVKAAISCSHDDCDGDGEGEHIVKIILMTEGNLCGQFGFSTVPKGVSSPGHPIALWPI